MFEKMKQAWRRDPYNFAAVMTATVGFLAWAAPIYPGIGVNTGLCGYRLISPDPSYSFLDLIFLSIGFGCPETGSTTADGVFRVSGSEDWFSLQRIPAVIFFFAVSAFFFFLAGRKSRKR